MQNVSTGVFQDRKDNDFTIGETHIFTVEPGDALMERNTGIQIQESVLAIEANSFQCEWNERDYNALVNWTENNPSQVSSQIIERKGPNESDYNVIATLSEIQNYNEYKDLSIRKNGVYYYRIKSQLINGETTLSEVRSILVKLGIKQFTANIYPNPATNLLTIVPQGVDYNDLNASLIDNNGKIILREIKLDNSNNTINVQELNAGVYWIMIKSEEINFIEKVVILK